VELRLVDGFEVLCGGERVELPLTAQRLVAFLALQERPLQRGYVAAKLWLDTLEEKAAGSLRSAIWRVRKTEIPLICTPDTRLALDPDVQVDLSAASALARQLIGDAADLDPWPVDLVPLQGEILPDWYDDWLVIERETHRQLRLHALEALAARLTVAGRYGEAVEVAMSAIAGEPLRESAHRALCRVYVTEGNASEALRHAELYRELLEAQLGLEPSPQFQQLVADLTPG
jgi:DNA-binding SARP family transcriptional activator